MRTQIIQKAVILNPDGEMLMMRRSKTDVRRPLQWDLPGGMLDDGEELLEGVRREIREEAALEVTDLEPVFSKTQVRRWKNHDGEYTQNAIFIFYTARTNSIDVKISDEHDKFQWKRIEEAIKEYEYNLHRELLQHIIDNDLLSLQA